MCNGNDDCLANDIPGCTQVNACNYNPDATVDDESCNFDSSHLFAAAFMGTKLVRSRRQQTLVDTLGDTVMAGGPLVNGTDNFMTHVITTTTCASCYRSRWPMRLVTACAMTGATVATALPSMTRRSHPVPILIS